MSLTTGARLARVHNGIRIQTSFLSAHPFHCPLGSSQTRTHPRIAPLRTQNASPIQLRLASTSPAPRPNPLTPEPGSTRPAPGPLSDPLNPPASTRPPPLDLPERDPSANLFTHLFRLGKAYTTFYKAGLKAVFTNRRLLRDLPDTPPPGLPLPPASARGRATAATVAATAPASLAPTRALDKTANPTRAALLLRARVRHDTARLPLFALVVLVCGEFTPFIVLLFPRLTPYTCRIPAQAAVIRRGIEARRAASLRALAYVPDSGDAAALRRVADGHICRSLGLGSPLWDRVGFDVPFARSRAADVVRRIVQDDTLLRSGGGVGALVDEEVVLACEERGIDTLGKDIASLRRRLGEWIAKSVPAQKGDEEAVVKEAAERVRGLLLGLDRPL
ncbi:hypothetical protein F4802DRAFT_218058 [Xylaria palmicola]|nr:hypothetical protein F4802DRAFT_218058 [Xylaria palmicola]